VTLKPSSPAAFDFLARVAHCYASLLDKSPADPENGLGGKLFYAGELDDDGRALVVAANIAGAATLVASADAASQKQALRDGVVDFVVTTLDEALRILKNQLRKRESVSVCVALPLPEPLPKIDCEMTERGVAPDLIRRDALAAPRREALELQDELRPETDPRKIPAVVTWRIDSALPKDLALLDEIALDCLDPEEGQARRWLRLAPRYLGRLAQGLRLLETHREFAARFRERVAQHTDRGDINFAFEISSQTRGGVPDEFRFDPTKL
jgi:Urocanase Rossmann-like domain